MAASGWGRGGKLHGVTERNQVGKGAVFKVANIGITGNQGLAIYQSPYQLPDGTSCFRSFICQVLYYSSESVSRNSHERPWFEYL